MRVLVVEDEPIIALNLQTILLDLGCRPVGPASSVDEAMALLAQRKFDAAILDISLSDGDSYALAEVLLERNLPVLFATGRFIENLPAHLTAIPVISKPFDLTALEACIASMRMQVEASAQCAHAAETASAADQALWCC